jgi:hypothetical protein
MGVFGGLYTLCSFKSLRLYTYSNMRYGFKNTHVGRRDVWAVARAQWSSFEICLKMIETAEVSSDSQS